MPTGDLVAMRMHLRSFPCSCVCIRMQCKTNIRARELLPTTELLGHAPPKCGMAFVAQIPDGKKTCLRWSDLRPPLRGRQHLPHLPPARAVGALAEALRVQGLVALLEHHRQQQSAHLPVLVQRQIQQHGPVVDLQGASHIQATQRALTRTPQSFQGLCGWRLCSLLPFCTGLPEQCRFCGRIVPDPKEEHGHQGQLDRRMHWSRHRGLAALRSFLLSLLAGANPEIDEAARLLRGLGPQELEGRCDLLATHDEPNRRGPPQAEHTKDDGQLRLAERRHELLPGNIGKRFSIFGWPPRHCQVELQDAGSGWVPVPAVGEGL
mmetsp:Transcript_158737/g.505340  ORF Transcript_158737/g.505340 Transcript_158737/m.505340 type:complete len:321 (+) Transcript_158737:30-992(+)